MPIEVVTDEHINAVLKQYFTNHPRFTVPFDAICYYGDYRILEWAATKICKFLQNHVECRYFMSYQESNIIFYLEDNNMVAKYSVEIPYRCRSEYEEVLRKKVFISYCHANKELVHRIVSQLRQGGVNLWIDEQDISVGEHILEAVLSGIQESDLAILFLSQDTLKSHFAQYEIKNVMQEIVYQNKTWYIIKMDDVEPKNIFPGLQQFKYYDLQSNPNDSDLVADILKKIKLITAEAQGPKGPSCCM